jgi:hypothetical protein
MIAAALAGGFEKPLHQVNLPSLQTGHWHMRSNRTKDSA